MPLVLVLTPLLFGLSFLSGMSATDTRAVECGRAPAPLCPAHAPEEDPRAD